MLAYCSYQGCTSKNVPFSSLTFFTLPKDHRRQIWIEHSGNPQLKNIGPNAVRSFCEKHFHPIDLKRQFNRTILFKTAVPYKYNPNDSDLIPPAIKKDGTILLNKEKNAQSTSQETEIPLVEIDEFEAPDSIEVMQEQDPAEEEFEHVEYVSQQFSDDDQSKKQYNEEEDVMQLLYVCEATSANIKQDVQEEVEHTESRTYSRKHRNPSPEPVPEQKRRRFLEELDEIVLNSPEEIKSYKSKPTSSSDYVEDQKNGVSTSSSPAEYEEDKHFALSLVGYFQRLPMKKKAFAKLKILSYLTELEYEDEAKL